MNDDFFVIAERPETDHKLAAVEKEAPAHCCGAISVLFVFQAAPADLTGYLQ